MRTAKAVDILFIIPPYHHRNGSGTMFPLGIGSIMAYLETRDYTFGCIDCTQMIDTMRDSDLWKLRAELVVALSEFDPAVIGIGPCVTSGLRGLEVVSEVCLDRFGAEAVFAGGPFVSLPSQEWFFYDELQLRYLIKGDGEWAVCDAVRTMKSKHTLSECPAVSVPGRSVVNVVGDLDSLPFPKRIGIKQNRYSDRRRLESEGLTAHIVASRGCPYSCDYCVSGNLNGVAYRKRSVGSIVEEMQYLSATHGVTDVIFYDDCFFTSPRSVHGEIAAFCDEIKNHGLSMTWQIEIRPDVVVEIDDNELELLVECGCRQMNIGVEKTYPDGAALFGKRYDFNKLREYLRHMHEVFPIRITGTFILGGKGETEDSVRNLILMSTEMHLDDVSYSPLFVYPDTPIYDDLFSNPREWVGIARKGLLGEVVYESPTLTKERLLELVTDANKAFFRNKPQMNTNRVRDRYRIQGTSLPQR